MVVEPVGGVAVDHLAHRRAVDEVVGEAELDGADGVQAGHGLVVDERGRGRFVCTSDTALNSEAPPLPFGEPIERDEFRCRSKQTGMRCINERTKHGFKLSRQRVSLY